ncbi:MAG TPA: LuxR family transcriptional regulator [Rugosimonospora sp.]|nr:LuxR family transcriptional regulator [Rugosimonospora sp.]
MITRRVSSNSEVRTVPAIAPGSTLLERGEQLSALVEAIVLAKSGRGGTTVVTGSAGSGRSALLCAAQRIAREHGLRVLPCLARQSPISTTLIPGISRLVAELGERPQDDPARLASMLAGASRSTPILVVADDVHELDAGSLRFLDALVRCADTEAIHVVLSWWASADDRGAQPLSLPGPVRRIRLRPLSAAAVSSLFQSRFTQHPSSALATQLYRTIGGNPSAVEAALEDLSHAESVGAWLTRTGPRFSRAVQRLLDTHQPTGLRLAAQALALFGDHCRPAILSQVIGLRLPQLSEIFDELSAIGLLAPGHLLRPRVRAAVRSFTDADMIRSLHLRTAEVLHTDRAPSRDIAQHLLEAGEAPQPWACGVLCAAAEDAARARCFENAIEILNLALDWCDREDLRLDIRARMVDVWWCAEPGRVAGLVQVLAESACGGKLPERWHPQLSRMLVWHGQASKARELIARDEAPSVDELPRLVERLISDVWLRHVFPWVPPSAELRSDLAASSHPWLPWAHALPTLLTEGDAERAATAATEVLHLVGPRELDLESAQAALFTLLSLERLDPASPSYRRLIREAEECGLASWRSLSAASEAAIAYWRGNVEEAGMLARQAIGFAGAGGWSVLVALPHAVRLIALTEQGRHSETVEALAINLPEESLLSPYGLLHLRARGLHYLSTNALYSAAADFRRIGEILTSWHMEAPGLLPWRTDLAEVCLRLGDCETSRSLAEEQLVLAASPTSWSGAYATRLLAKAGSATPCTSTTQQLNALESRKPSCGDNRWTTLSWAEDRVARLAYQGYTNREISKALYITRSTVEQHLTRIYRKLMINGREGLVAAFARPDAQTTQKPSAGQSGTLESIADLHGRGPTAAGESGRRSAA